VGSGWERTVLCGLDGNLKVAAIMESGETLSVQGVHALFRYPFVSRRVHTFFDLASKDGQRFIGSAAPDTSSLPLNVVTNWTAELKRK
jgi:hypothetical protein